MERNHNNNFYILPDEPVEGNPMAEIFISYAHANDEPFVEQIHNDLTEHGFDVWWDWQTMQSRGLTFLQELLDAIEGSDRLIAVISPNTVQSDYVRAEWEHALLFSREVVPILREGDYSLIPDELSKFHCPDFRRERPYNEALVELLRILAEPVPLLGHFRTAVPSLPPHFLPQPRPGWHPQLETFYYFPGLSRKPPKMGNF